jgi:hypothetical protein
MFDTEIGSEVVGLGSATDTITDFDTAPTMLLAVHVKFPESSVLAETTISWLPTTP